jgi:hypothetical protein
MHLATVRQKVSATLKKIGHAPKIRKGNGHGPTAAQSLLAQALGIGWKLEFVVVTKAGHRNKVYPNCYKIDIANPELMIAIEVDGGSHLTLDRQAQDRKKTAFLTSAGWKVCRVSNAEAIRLSTTCTCPDTLLTSLTEF